MSSPTSVSSSPKAVLLKFLQYFQEDIILGEGYPRQLLFLHAIKANASWRKHVENDTRNGNYKTPSWLYDFACAYFCHAFGGTTVRDVLMAQTPSLFTNPDVPRAFFLAFAAVSYSPFDVVYRLIDTPRTPVSLLVTAYEAVDSSTTVCGSIEKAKRLFPESQLAPFIAALLAGIGGSFFRYIERRFGRGWNVSTELSQPTVTTRTTLLYAIAYMQLREVVGWSKARLYIASFHVVWQILKELTGKPLDFTRNTVGKLLL